MRRTAYVNICSCTRANFPNSYLIRVRVCLYPEPFDFPGLMWRLAITQNAAGALARSDNKCSVVGGGEHKSKTPPWRRSDHKNLSSLGFGVDNRVWSIYLRFSHFAHNTTIPCPWPFSKAMRPDPSVSQIGELSNSDYRAGAETNLHNYDLNSKFKLQMYTERNRATTSIISGQGLEYGWAS